MSIGRQILQHGTYFIANSIKYNAFTNGIIIAKIVMGCGLRNSNKTMIGE